MSDIAPEGTTNWGPILNSIPQGIANIGLTQAQAGLTGQQSGVAAQQAQGLNIANQKAALALGLYQHVLGDFTGQPMQGVPDESPGGSTPGAAVPTAGASAPSLVPAAGAQQPGAGAQQPGAGSDQSADGISSVFPENDAPLALRDFFFVNPAGNARSQSMMLAASLTGDPGLIGYAKAQRDLQVQSDSAESQQKAQDLYDLMSAVTSAPKGAALASLARIDPGTASRIEKQYPNDPADQDMAARESAAHLAAVTHQWTGRPLVLGPDGVYRDKVTGMKVPVPVAGMSPAAYAGLSAKGEALVAVPQSDGTSKQLPLWQADGAPNLAAWTAQQAARGQAQLHPAVAPGVATLAAMARTPGAGAPGAGPQSAPQAAPQPPPAAPQSAATPAQQAYVAQMRTALADPQYRLQQPKVASGQTASPVVLAQMQQTVKSRAQLMQDAQSATQAAAQSLTYLKAAQSIMASKGLKPVGLTGPVTAEVMRLFGTNWSTKYQEIAKYLSNAALQNARATYGARMTQSEVRLQLQQMNPSAHMTTAAINSLLAENIRNAAYTLSAARNVRPYLTAGDDPQSFAEWQQQYFPQQKIVNEQPTGTASTRAPVTGAPPAALAYLAAHPQLAADFQAKYGYLPQGFTNGR